MCAVGKRRGGSRNASFEELMEATPGPLSVPVWKASKQSSKEAGGRSLNDDDGEIYAVWSSPLSSQFPSKRFSCGKHLSAALAE
ncbi:unnamed protein product [Hydatigera taeniaeformis]|uniref:Uncharacterized protein n=1 Tax=Hydatigena taeniaeformis TaxID=6205 RepID=A0A0R3XB13_HYDTA|nr:unnamed protein product [Hydatigera taeniaeformis]